MTKKLAPTWTRALPILTWALGYGTDEGKALALAELKVMAEAADAFNAGVPEEVETPAPAPVDADHELMRIRFAVETHDRKLNEGEGDEGPRPPTGDDYNALYRVVMQGVHPSKRWHDGSTLAALELARQTIAMDAPGAAWTLSVVDKAIANIKEGDI